MNTMMKAEQDFLGRMQPLPFIHTFKGSPEILSGFRSAQIADALALNSQQTTIDTFQLGDRILSYTAPSANNYSGEFLSASTCYLIFEGQVRLLCQNVHLKRQVSADLLQAGAVFGVDHLFSTMPLSYDAVATSPCRIIQIPYDQLTRQLEQSVQLCEYLSQSVQQRERLIFFKCLTQQRSLPNRILKYVILPQLVEHQIYAGAYISQSLPATTGFFWLRAGQILNQSNCAASPVIGESWGYPNPIPQDWVAQTDLTIYELPFDPWKTQGLLRL